MENRDPGAQNPRTLTRGSPSRDAPPLPVVLDQGAVLSLVVDVDAGCGSSEDCREVGEVTERRAGVGGSDAPASPRAFDFLVQFAELVPEAARGGGAAGTRGRGPRGWLGGGGGYGERPGEEEREERSRSSQQGGVLYAVAASAVDAGRVVEEAFVGDDVLVPPAWVSGAGAEEQRRRYGVGGVGGELGGVDDKVRGAGVLEPGAFLVRAT